MKTLRTLRFLLPVGLFGLAGLVLTLYSNSPQERFAEAERLFQSSFFAEATEIYREVIPVLSGEDKHQAMFRLGLSLQRQGRVETQEAIDRYTDLIEIEEADPLLRANALIQRGTIYGNDRRNEEAVASWEAVLDLEGATGTQVGLANLFRGYNLNRQEKWDEAIESFMAVYNSEEANAVHRGSAMMAIGSMNMRNRNYEAAKEAYELVIALPGSGSKNISDSRGHLNMIEAMLSGDPGFWLDPYLTRVEVDRATLFWVSTPEETLGKVELQEGETVREFESTTDTPFRDRGELRHRVEFTELKPFTEYTYRVTVGESVREGRFRTPPAAGERKPFRFIVLGDTQDFPDRTTRVAAKIGEEEDFDFVLHLGDMVGRGSDWGHWKIQYFDPSRPYLIRAPVYPTYGNHDGGPLYAPLFDLPGSTLYHKVTWGNIEVYVLQAHGTGGAHRTRQLAWLEEELAASKADWKFSILHYPMFYGGQLPSMRNASWGRDDILPLM